MLLSTVIIDGSGVDRRERDDRERKRHIGEVGRLEPEGGHDDRFGDRPGDEERAGAEKYEREPSECGPDETAFPLAAVEVAGAREADDQERPRSTVERRRTTQRLP